MGFTVQNVCFDHANGTNALKNISLRINSGECVAIIGPSGSGKTTLLSVLATALKPSSGTFEYKGSNPWLMSKGALKKLRSLIGTVHQSPPIPSQQRVVTAVLAGRLGQWSLLKSVLSLIYPLDLQGAHRSLERLQLADRLFERCDQLSGGQFQRVGVARVLYQAPELILADEPVSAMDPVLSDVVIKELIDESTSRGASLVASLHDVDLAIRWFPRIIGIKKGEVAFDRPSVEVNEHMLRDLYASEMDTNRAESVTLS